jgi:hypothetical protein
MRSDDAVQRSSRPSRRRSPTGGSVRHAILIGASSFVSCALFTDLSGFSDEARPSGDAAPLGDAIESEATIREAAVEDATRLPDGGEAPTPDGGIFADSFDTPDPLPRGWDSTTGAVLRVDGPGAKSGSGSLRAVSSPPSAAAFVEKNLLTPGKSSVTCGFAVKVTKFSGANSIHVAELHVSDLYVRFDVTNNHWYFYGQQGTLDYAGNAARNMLDEWVDVTLTIASDGAITVIVGGVTRTAKVASAVTGRMGLSLGLVDAPQLSEAYEVGFDDVVCSAR